MFFRILLLTCLILPQHQSNALNPFQSWLRAASNVWNAFLDLFDAKIALTQQTIVSIVDCLKRVIGNVTYIFTGTLPSSSQSTSARRPGAFGQGGSQNQLNNTQTPAPGRAAGPGTRP